LPQRGAGNQVDEGLPFERTEVLRRPQPLPCVVEGRHVDRRSGIAAAVLEGRMFVFGGEAPADTFNQTEAYDARSNG
jgi:hypothetical protein